MALIKTSSHSFREIRLSLCIYGAGAYGSALALSLARQGQEVILTGREGVSLASAKANAQLRHDNLSVRDFTPVVIEQAQAVLLSTKSQAVRETLAQITPYLLAQQSLLCLAKGMEISTGLALYELSPRLGFLSGPSFAAELMQGKPAALSVADKQNAKELAALLSGAQLRVYPSQDIIGISLSGAMKNIIAIACGIAEGLGLGASAQASLMSRGAVEIQRFIAFKGGDQSSIMQPAGFGDLALTCFSNLSRNRQFGIALGEGKTVDAAQSRIGLVEGASCAQAIVDFCHKQRSQYDSLAPYLPITFAVKAVIAGEVSVAQAQAQLME